MEVEGIDDPSVSPAASHLPLHKGGFGGVPTEDDESLERNSGGLPLSQKSEIFASSPTGEPRAYGIRAAGIVEVTQKLLVQVDRMMERSEALTPQGLKHLSGVLKDIRDLQQRQDNGAQTVTVVLEGAVDGYGK